MSSPGVRAAAENVCLEIYNEYARLGKPDSLPTHARTPDRLPRSPTMSTPARRRLMRDFKRMQNDPPEGVNGAPQDNDIMKWHAVIFGCLPTSQPHEAHRSPHA